MHWVFLIQFLQLQRIRILFFYVMSNLLSCEDKLRKNRVEMDEIDGLNECDGPFSMEIALDGLYFDTTLAIDDGWMVLKLPVAPMNYRHYLLP